MPPPKALRKALLDYALAALFFVIAANAVHWLITGRLLFSQNGAGEAADPEAPRATAGESPAGGGADLTPFDDPALTAWSLNPDKVDKGRESYLVLCAACHAEDLTATLDGEPLPALSLIDADWKYGSRPTEIYALIRDGTPRGSTGQNGLKMLPWGESLKPAQIAALVAFILARNRPLSDGLSPSPH